MKHFLIWIFLFFFAMSGFAQDLNIKGQITDTSGESIIGVNVKVKGKDTGTITDIDGNYHLQAASNDILVVSYIGFGSILDQITSMGRNSLIGLPPEFKQILGLLRIGEVFTMYSSAVSIKMMYQYGLSNGTIKRMRYR